MGIAGVEPRQLALIVGTMGSGSTDSPAPSPTTTIDSTPIVIDTAIDTAIDTTIGSAPIVIDTAIDSAPSAIDTAIDNASSVIDTIIDGASPTVNIDGVEPMIALGLIIDLAATAIIGPSQARQDLLRQELEVLT
jgi:hypothetical protein